MPAIGKRREKRFAAETFNLQPCAPLSREVAILGTHDYAERSLFSCTA